MVPFRLMELSVRNLSNGGSDAGRPPVRTPYWSDRDVSALGVAKLAKEAVKLLMQPEYWAQRPVELFDWTQ